MTAAPRRHDQIGGDGIGADLKPPARGLRIRRDHVIEAMVKGLGARVIEIEAPFDPEGGAYAGGGHAHAAASDPFKSMPRQASSIT